MSPRHDWKRLNDIRRRCDSAAELVARGRESVEEDELLVFALERIIEVAGEAATRLDEATRARFPTVDWQGLMGARVLLAHAYHRVLFDRLWQIAVEEMPKLAEALGPLSEGETD